MKTRQVAEKLRSQSYPFTGLPRDTVRPGNLFGKAVSSHCESRRGKGLGIRDQEATLYRCARSFIPLREIRSIVPPTRNSFETEGPRIRGRGSAIGLLTPIC